MKKSTSVKSKKTFAKRKGNSTQYKGKVKPVEPQHPGMPPTPVKEAETVTTKNVNAPKEKPTMKPLRKTVDEDTGENWQTNQDENVPNIGSKIPEPPPFSPAVTQKGHHAVVQT